MLISGIIELGIKKASELKTFENKGRILLFKFLTTYMYFGASDKPTKIY